MVLPIVAEPQATRLLLATQTATNSLQELGYWQYGTQDQRLDRKVANLNGPLRHEPLRLYCPDNRFPEPGWINEHTYKYVLVELYSA